MVTTGQRAHYTAVGVAFLRGCMQLGEAIGVSVEPAADAGTVVVKIGDVGIRRGAARIRMTTLSALSWLAPSLTRGNRRPWATR